MEKFPLYIALGGIVLLFGVSLNRFSKYLKMPILLCFLGVGVLIGKYGLNLVPPTLQMNRVRIFGEIALCFIIFSGGLETSYRSIKRVFVTGTILATFGVILTAFGMAFFIYFYSKLSLFITIGATTAILFGSITSSTDAAAVFAILRGQKVAINPRLQGLLEYESGSNDPAAFLLTMVMIGVCQSSSTGIHFAELSWNITSGIIWGLGMGTLFGFLLGLFGQWFYNWVQSFLEYNGLRFAIAVALVLLGYGITNGVLHANSLMACYVAGITMGNLRFNFKTIFIKFQNGISWLMQIMLFTLLGVFFDFRVFFNIRNMLGAAMVTLTIMFIVRPVVVMICMAKSSFNFRERLFVSWVGIRGSAPIMLATLVTANPPVELADRAQNIFYMTFTIVLFSILIQGSSLTWVAKKLKLVRPLEEKEEMLLEYEERADGREIYQFTVTNDNILVNRLLPAEILDTEPLLLMVKREKKYIQPQKNILIRSGDTLTFLGERDAMQQLRDRFFPNEEYAPDQTFHQLWDQWAKKHVSMRRRKKTT